MSLDLSDVATELLEELGSTTYISIISETGGTFDPVAGETTAATTTETFITGAVLSVDEKLIDGERIQFGDKMVIMDSKVTPKMDNQIKFGGKTYQIVNIDGFNHAGTQQYWEVICRG